MTEREDNGNNTPGTRASTLNKQTTPRVHPVISGANLIFGPLLRTPPGTVPGGVSQSHRWLVALVIRISRAGLRKDSSSGGFSVGRLSL